MLLNYELYVLNKNIIQQFILIDYKYILFNLKQWIELIKFKKLHQK